MTKFSHGKAPHSNFEYFVVFLKNFTPNLSHDVLNKLISMKKNSLVEIKNAIFGHVGGSVVLCIDQSNIR